MIWLDFLVIRVWLLGSPQNLVLTYLTCFISSMEPVLFRGSDNYLSNLYKAEITIDGHSYHSTEQFYQYRAARYVNNTAVADRIMESECGMGAKVASRAMRKQIARSDWYSGPAQETMETAVREKFRSHPGLRTRLLGTHPSPLGELNLDPFWAIGLRTTNPDRFNPKKWTGQNKMGELLMSLRSEFREVVPLMSLEVEPTPSLVSSLAGRILRVGGAIGKKGRKPSRRRRKRAKATPPVGNPPTHMPEEPSEALNPPTPLMNVNLDSPSPVVGPKLGHSLPSGPPSSGVEDLHLPINPGDSRLYQCPICIERHWNLEEHVVFARVCPPPLVVSPMPGLFCMS